MKLASQQLFFFFFLLWLKFYYDNNLWLCSGWLLGWGLWGIGKQSSPQQAFSAAGFPVVAVQGRTWPKWRGWTAAQHHAQPTKRSVYNLTAAYMWFGWDARWNVHQTVLQHMATLLDFTENRALVAGNPLFSPHTVFFSTCGFSLLESESTEAEIRRQVRSLSLRSPFSPHSPLYIHMHLVWVLLTLQSAPQSRPLFLASLCFPYFINSDI